MHTARTPSQLSYGQSEFKMDRRSPQIYKELISIRLIRLKGKRKASVKLRSILRKCLFDKCREDRYQSMPWHFHLSLSKGLIAIPPLPSSQSLNLDGNNEDMERSNKWSFVKSPRGNKEVQWGPAGGVGWRLPLACIPGSGGGRSRGRPLTGAGGGLPASSHHPLIPAPGEGLFIGYKKVQFRETSADPGTSTCYVTLGKFVNLPVPQSPCL